MNILKDIVLNQLIKIPAIRKAAKRNHRTGMNESPEGASEHYEILTRFSSVKDARILELGPGKSVEITARAKRDGAAVVSIADIERYLTDEQIAEHGIDYRIYDGTKLPFPDGAFDLIWSTSVYEHVRFPKKMVEESYRVLSPGGRVVHLIDLVDHFYYDTFAPEIIFNCLKYPEWVWNAMTWNRSNYVNRIRASEWIDLHRTAGFAIVDETVETSKYILDNYKSDDSLSYLRKHSENDAVTTSLQLVGEKPR